MHVVTPRIRRNVFAGTTSRMTTPSGAPMAVPAPSVRATDHVTSARRRTVNHTLMTDPARKTTTTALLVGRTKASRGTAKRAKPNPTARCTTAEPKTMAAVAATVSAVITVRLRGVPADPAPASAPPSVPGPECGDDSGEAE